MNNSQFTQLQLIHTPQPTKWYWGISKGISGPPDYKPCDNLFVQVFEFPEVTSGQFCFDGGNAVIFRQRNWFESNLPDPDYKDLKDFLTKQMNADNVLQQGRKYLVILSNGDTFIFPKIEC